MDNEEQRDYTEEASNRADIEREGRAELAAEHRAELAAERHPLPDAYDGGTW